MVLNNNNYDHKYSKNNYNTDKTILDIIFM